MDNEFNDLSILLDKMIIKSKNENSLREYIQNSLNDYFCLEKKNIVETFSFIERHTNICSEDQNKKFEYELQRLNLLDYFNQNFPQMKEFTQQNFRKYQILRNDLKSFFEIFNDVEILNQFPEHDNDPDLENEKEFDLYTLNYIYNIFIGMDYPIIVFHDIDKMNYFFDENGDKLVDKCKSIANNVLKKCFLKKYILENPKIYVKDFMNYLLSIYDSQCKSFYEKDLFQQVSVSFFKKNIIQPILDSNDVSQFDFPKIFEIFKHYLVEISSKFSNYSDKIKDLIKYPVVLKMRDAFSYIKTLNDFKIPFYPELRDEKIVMDITQFSLTETDINVLKLDSFSKELHQVCVKLEPKTNREIYYLDFWCLISNLFLSNDLYNLLLAILNDDNKLDELKRKYFNSCINMDKKEALGAFLSIIDIFKHNSNQSFGLGDFKKFSNINAEYLQNAFTKTAFSPLIQKLGDYTYYFNKLIDPSENESIYEYNFVYIVEQGYYNFVIDPESITLVKNENITKDSKIGDFSNEETIISHAKIKLIATKLNITMFESKEGSNFFNNSQKFLSVFQLSEKLKSELKELSLLNNYKSKKKHLISKLDEDKELDNKINKIIKTRIKIENTLNQHLSGCLSCFTKEHLCALFNCVSENKIDEINTLLMATLHLNYNDLINEQSYKLFYKQIKSKMKFELFLDTLSNFINEISKNKELFQKKNVNFETQNMSMLYNMILNNEISSFIKNDYNDIPGIIFDLFYHFSHELPKINQMMICTKLISVRTIDNFLNFFKYANQFHDNLEQNNLLFTNLKIFLVINPHYLSPEVFDYFKSKIYDLQYEVIGNARLVMVCSPSNSLFINYFQSYRIIQVSGSVLESSLEIFYKDKFNNINNNNLESFFIYSKNPRTGKSHMIKKYIYDNYQEHIYVRILIDTNTSLSKLISLLRHYSNLRTSHTLCFHFNIDGSIDKGFMLYIVMLTLFNCLNDGFSIPYVINPFTKTAFFYEFGSKMGENETEFLNTTFPIGKFMKRLTEFKKTRNFFSFDEYFTEYSLEIGNSTYNHIICHQNYRTYLIEASALVKLKQKEESNKFCNISHQQFQTLFDETKDKFKENPKKSYSILKSLYPSGSKPLISQLSDISKIISLLAPVAFLKQIYEHENTTNNLHNPLRFMVLSLIFETALINCGVPYSQPDVKNSIESDEIRFNDAIKWFEKAARILIVTSINTNNTESFGIQTIQHPNNFENNTGNHKITQTIDKEFKINDNMLKKMLFSDSDWKVIERNQIEMLKELEVIFSLKTININSTLTMCYLLWNSMTPDKQKRFDQLPSMKNGTFFKDILTIQNFSYTKKNMEYFPKNPDDTEKEFLTKFAYAYRTYCGGNKNKTNVELESECKKAKIRKIQDVIDIFQQYVLRHSMLRIYSLTIHNIERFIHIIYRIFSGIPVIMMGETGSGKTFSVKFLKEIIGKNTKLVIRCFDGGTDENQIREFININIQIFEKENNENNKNQGFLVFFFDEVNTSSCQWFIKELILDRFLDGKNIPDYVRFICAVNPKRRAPKSLDSKISALPPFNDDISGLTEEDNEIRKLIYKVRQMPESFVPFLFPSDASRNYKNFNDVESYESLSEFEKVCERAVDQRMDEKPLPNNYSHTSELIHFSSKCNYSTCFNWEFFKENTNSYFTSFQIAFRMHEFISRLNIYAGRIITEEVYQDPSFMSIREPERCVHLMRWFYSEGIFDHKKDENKIIRFRKSFLFAFAATYWLRLSSFSNEKEGENTSSERDIFLEKIIKMWEKLLQNSRYKVLADYMKVPELSEWNNLIKDEEHKYADEFVGNDEGISKNDILCENIWSVFICISNNIPLWIIGYPGTSKSLAVNTVLNKIFVGILSKQLPPLISQTYLCSKFSRSEALLDQMNRIAEKSSFLKANDTLNVLVLEEIGHADLSPYLPLKCLNHVIDEGYSISNSSKALPITIIGLSNYKMDSAKLNRGILLTKTELSSEQKITTALDIFKSTAYSLFEINQDTHNLESFIHKEKYQNIICKMANNFMPNLNRTQTFSGFRDFYGIIKHLTYVLFYYKLTDKKKLKFAVARNINGQTYEQMLNFIFNFNRNNNINKNYPKGISLINDNFNEDWGKLKYPLGRHILITTKEYSALNLILSSFKIINFNIIFSENYTGLPDDEWISNDLKKVALSMTKGEKIIFIGNHPCFNSLYDVFNVRYQTINDSKYALISYAGDSTMIKVHPNFRVIIIIEEYVLKNLPLPFLNRFEKINLDYDTFLSNEMKESAKNMRSYTLSLFPDFYHKDDVSNENLHFKIFSSNKETVLFPSLENSIQYYFGCYSRSHFDAITYLQQRLSLNSQQAIQSIFLSCQPSKLLIASRKYENSKIEILKAILQSLSILKSSLIHIIYFYEYIQLPKEYQNSLAETIYNNWKMKKENEVPGIQAILLVPFIQQFNQNTFEPFGKLIHINLTEKTNEKKLVQTVLDKSLNTQHKSLILIISAEHQTQFSKQFLLHIQTIISSLRSEIYEKNNHLIFHAFILIDMSEWNTGLNFVQTVEWPVIFLDTCISTKIKPISNSLQAVDLSSILFTPLSNLFSEDTLNSELFFEEVKTNIFQIYSKQEQKSLKELLTNSITWKFLKSLFTQKLMKTIPEFLVSLDSKQSDNNTDPWFISHLDNLSYPVPSILEFLSLKLIQITQNIFSLLLRIIFSCSNFNIDLSNKTNVSIIEFLINTPLIKSKIHNIIIFENAPIFRIETRYLNDKNSPLEWQVYDFIWEWILFNNRSKKNDDKSNTLKYQQIQKEFLQLFTNHMNDNIAKALICPKTISNSFFAAYLLLVCPTINVSNSDQDRMCFLNLISLIRNILSSIFSLKPDDSLSLYMSALMSYDLFKDYIARVAICYQFIPQSFQITNFSDDIITNLVTCFSDVVINIVDNIFSHKFSNKFELIQFFTTIFPVLNSLIIEFTYAPFPDDYCFSLMTYKMNILKMVYKMFNTFQSKINMSIWKLKSFSFSCDESPTTIQNITNIIKPLAEQLVKCGASQKKVDKLILSLVSDYCIDEQSLYHGFFDPEE